MNIGKVLPEWLRPAPVEAETDTLSASRSHVGKVRAINEDRVLDDPEHGLWAIADGMGGHAAGDIAAEAAIAALREIPRLGPVTAEAIETALRRVNGQLVRRASEGAPMSGATIVAAFASDEGMTILWAGDCRAYRLRDGRCEPLTRDHSVVQELLDAGVIDADQAARHPQAHVVTRALGAREAFALDAVSIRLAKGETLLLCSDGLSLPLPILARSARPGADRLGDAADRLLEQALAAGGHDNISLIMVTGG